MYFPVGWPKVLKLPELGRFSIKQIVCNRDRILFAILTDDSLALWFCKPCAPIVFHRRTPDSLHKLGTNILVEWKPDSSMLVIVTSEGHLLFYNVGVIADQKGFYVQTDSPHANLRRDSAELFIKETIPPLHLTLRDEVAVWDGAITSIVCITMTELMVATARGHVLRYRWDGTQNRDYNLDLRRVPFCINQQVSKAVPIVEENTYIVDMEYSPLVGGFAVVFNDGRAAFLTASSLKFDPNQTQGIWAQNVEDATCTTVNHKYRLITFGRANSECVVYCIDESTGGLEVSHCCVLSSKDYPGRPGTVGQVKWTPDGCAMVASWTRGGIAVWSTFGALLMCSLGWDYGLNVDLEKCNPLRVTSMEWATEGYQLWMVRKHDHVSADETNANIPPGENLDAASYSVIQLDFAKSALAVNPCMSHQSHLFLQGDDRLYINTAAALIKLFSDRSAKEDGVLGENGTFASASGLSEGRQWLVVPIPGTYSSTNWPVRYAAIDHVGQNLAIAGRAGFAHYSMPARRWKLFGNETQEKDFVVIGGLLWWRDYVVMGCYSIIDNRDEIRFYARDSKLDNKFARVVRADAPVLLVNNLHDQLITFGSDAQLTIWSLTQIDAAGNVEADRIQTVDISALCVHPACVTSVTLTALRTETGRGGQCGRNTGSVVLNVSGRLLLVQRETQNGDRYTCCMPTVLASCVENVWVPSRRKADKVHLTEALWLFCGSHGMRVWLPLFPRDGDKTHTFMSKRIMLPFSLRIYPLAILFEDAIILGTENDTLLYTTDSASPFSLPFSVLERTSQVYLHQILRQLIRRNLGYHAWEIARSCNSLPYFPHSLELLLHEVLEEEATSKEPIPDAQLPSVVEFIMEFPVYLQTVVQCARKTEIALWPYLFSAAGKPKDLFGECMAKRQLDTAASYLIILQNLETSSVSRQHATLLLDTALDQSKWELSRELVRFLRAIDPNDVESPRTSFVLSGKLGLNQQTPPVTPNAEDLSFILGSVQGPRGRSFSTTVAPKFPGESVTTTSPGTAAVVAVAAAADSPVILRRKKSVPAKANENNKDSSTAEEFFMDVILQRHARRLLSSARLADLDYFAAHLDFHLVTWLARERDRAARIDDFILALKRLHEEFEWPYPVSGVADGTAAAATPTPGSPTKATEGVRGQAYAASGSRVGDSGYVSFPGGLPCSGIDLETSVRAATEGGGAGAGGEHPLSGRGVLKDGTSAFDDDKSVALECIGRDVLNDGSLTSAAVSSVWEDENDADSGGGFAKTENWEMPTGHVLERLSVSDTRGSQRSDVQLRYLSQLFLEAGCLEWSLVISILLRDAMAVLRTVNAARSSDQSVEAVSRLRQGLQLLHYWTNRECLGYKNFMLVIQNQIAVLSKVLTAKAQQQQIQARQQAVSVGLGKASGGPRLSRSRRTSSNQDSNSQTGGGGGGSCGIKEKTGGVPSSNDPRLTEAVHGSSKATAMDDRYVCDDDENSIIPESTGCTIS